MEHSQGTICVFVCVRLFVCVSMSEIMLDWESEGEAREGHTTTVEHTQSQAP